MVDTHNALAALHHHSVLLDVAIESRNASNVSLFNQVIVVAVVRAALRNQVRVCVMKSGR
jgi:hypothetical protein